MTTADLARAELIKLPSMGAILASLEQKGLVERQLHPIDRRQMHFGLTEAGTEVRTGAAPPSGIGWSWPRPNRQHAERSPLRS